MNDNGIGLFGVMYCHSGDSPFYYVEIYKQEVKYGTKTGAIKHGKL
jgi:hypothetical protein